jgi:iron(III) transport system substrate-binding protein
MTIFENCKSRLSLVVLSAGLIAGVVSAPALSQELNIYSHRQAFLLNPLLEDFKKQTGTKINIVFASKGLIQRLIAEGPRSPADIILTVDIARLQQYANKGLFAPVSSPVLKANIPAHLRDPNGLWYGLSKRVRVVAVSKSRVRKGAIKRIEDLADPKWRGKICTRKGSHVYNRALLASLIAAHGEAAAEKWARGLVANLARKPQGNDRAQAKAISQGICDIAIMNHYYYFKMKKNNNPAQHKWAKAIRILFTNQSDRGNHVNISGIGLAKHSKNRKLAIKLMEYLSSKQAQSLYAKVNYEYPANAAVNASPEVKILGEFKADKLPIATIAKLAPTAQRIIDRVGW